MDLPACHDEWSSWCLWLDTAIHSLFSTSCLNQVGHFRSVSIVRAWRAREEQFAKTNTRQRLHDTTTIEIHNWGDAAIDVMAKQGA
jgi:hypothetical protein